MDRVIAAQVYNRICELGSLSAAARALGISRPMVSRYLEQMEKWAGTRLVNRSTRKLTLTAAGEKVLQKTRTLSQISQEIEGQSEKDLPSGTLRVACAHFTAMHLIAPVLPGLLSRYPQLRILWLLRRLDLDDAGLRCQRRCAVCQMLFRHACSPPVFATQTLPQPCSESY